jgi:hypothetical protein
VGKKYGSKGYPQGNAAHMGPVLRATTTAVEMAAPVRNILDTASYFSLSATQGGMGSKLQTSIYFAF